MSDNLASLCPICHNETRLTKEGLYAEHNSGVIPFEYVACAASGRTPEWAEHLLKASQSGER